MMDYTVHNTLLLANLFKLCSEKVTFISVFCQEMHQQHLNTSLIAIFRVACKINRMPALTYDTAAHNAWV